jgi:type IV secretory pathway protease TraF
MFIIYEYAACVVVALIAATLLCAACVMFLLLKNGASSVARKLQGLIHGARPVIPGTLVMAEPHES